MKRLWLMASVVTAVCGVEAGDAVEAPEGIAEKAPFVSADFSLAFDSKFMSYGLVDNNDPIVTPSASITFFDHLTFEGAALFDTTKYGKKWGEYGNRGGKYMELDAGTALGCEFGTEDCEWLPTTVSLSLGYSYEYHPRHMGGCTGEAGDDTQFVVLDIELPDLWLEPVLEIERDIDRDNGTYAKLELGHTFPLIDGEEDEPLLAFKPSVSQGIGDVHRTRGYDLAADHGGLMDTCVKGDLTWKICNNLSLCVYVAYYDYLFDSTLRDGARNYEASGRADRSWNFLGGLALTACF